MTENEAIKKLNMLDEALNFQRHDADECSCALQMAIQAIEEFKALKENKSEWKYSRKENIATCKNCSYEHYLGTYHQYATNYCPKCGSKMTET